MEFRLSAIISKEGMLFVAKGLEIEIVSQGTTFEEAISNLKEAFALWLKHAEPKELELFKGVEAPIVTQIAATA